METVIDIVEKAHLVAGVLLNSLLLFAIRNFTKRALGSYKQLLTIFASFDVFLIVIHAAAKPKVVIVGTTFGIWSAFENRALTSFYGGCFTVPFALMIIHFVYRFWSICHPELIPLFSNKKFIAALVCFTVVSLFSWTLFATYGTTGTNDEPGKTLLQTEARRRFGKAMREGWLVMNHWENAHFNTHVFVTLVYADVIMVVSFSVASMLAWLIYNDIKRADRSTFQSTNLQLKVLIVLCAQTFVPLVCVYIPYFCVLSFPFFGLPTFFFQHACMMLTACFPAWDAVITIVLMKDYREGLLGMLKKKAAVLPVSVWQTNVISIAPAITTV